SNMFWDNPGYKLTPEQDLLLASHYVQSIVAQQWANQAAAVLAGKFPMIMTLTPGGMKAIPTLEQIIYYQDMMIQVKAFTDNVLWNDLLMVAPAYLDLATYGIGTTNLLTWGLLDGKEQTLEDRVFPAGAIFKGDLANVITPDPQKVQMYTKYSWFPDNLGEGKAPLETGQEPQDYTELPPMEGEAFPEGKYDWTMAARYPDPSGKGAPMEVGPLAQVVIAYLKKEPKTVEYVDAVLKAVGQEGKPQVLFSNLGRIAARIIKARVNMDYALQWSDELLANIKNGNTDVWIDPPNKSGDGEGWGAQDAPRGALSHYCRTKGGTVDTWAAVPASNWNLSPRDDEGVRGPVEEALVGTPVAVIDQPLEIMRTVHTFDP
ncbi:MAG: nickel-dependent hydrogenase large subunit, partial [Coriobacteriales bacterium]|nr:nickel-dependent hydrogenase large subunit [Coriobacteriales bacterium]